MDNEYKIKQFAGEIRSLSGRIGIFVAQLPSGDETLERVTDELLAISEDVEEAAEDYAEPEDEECSSCMGLGYFDEDGEPSSDRRDRKCSDCQGTGLM